VINPLPDFAFYAKEKVEIKQLDFADAFERHLIEPMTFQDTYNHPDPSQCKKWHEAIKKEFHDMTHRGVWHKVKRSTIPQGRRCIKSKWVLKIKRNGIFCTWLVACGYSQIPGVDFTKNYAPVMNDVTWRILLIAMLIWKMDAIIIDVETAFLHGKLHKEIYMDLPAGGSGIFAHNGR